MNLNEFEWIWMNLKFIDVTLIFHNSTQYWANLVNFSVLKLDILKIQL